MAQHRLPSMISRKKKLELAQWLERVMEGAGFNQSQLARELGAALKEPIDRSIVNKMIKGTRTIKAHELLAIEKITHSQAPIDPGEVQTIIKIPAPAANNPRRDPIMPDGEKIEITRLNPEQAKVAAGYHNAEVWRLNSGTMAEKYQPGTFLLVDMEAKPRPGSIVLALYDNCPIFREWSPPWLCTRSLTIADYREPVDGRQTAVIKGVVIAMLPA